MFSGGLCGVCTAVLKPETRSKGGAIEQDSRGKKTGAKAGSLPGSAGADPNWSG
jgi:hypothetical protein